jgi:hypothetical protein
MKRLVLIAIMFFLFLFQSCEKEVLELGIRMVFEETQCGNPWQILPNSKNFLFEVHQYLNSEGIEVFSINIKNAPRGLVVCDACDCPSGRKIIIRIPETDKEKAESVGFRLL